MRAGELIEVVAANVIILFLLFLVLGDEAQRSAYAASRGFSFYLSRTFLTQVSALQTPRGPLQSPLSLDWVQLLVAVFIIIDVLFAYGLLERRRKARSPAP